MDKIVFKELIKGITETWEPQKIADVNETALRVARVEGAYDWHVHAREDEFFFVLEGNIFIDTEHGSVELAEGEGFLVKRGLRHRSRSEKPAWILLVEPTRTRTKG